MKRFFRPITFFLLLSLLITTGQGCLGGGGSTGGAVQRIELNYWRVFDGEDAFADIIRAYQAQHPNVRINYRKLRFDEYEEELVRALAEGRGPDIFSVHNTWMREYQDLMQPMPASVTVTRLEERGTLRKEVVAVQRQKPTITKNQLARAYVDVVAQEVILPYQAAPRAEVEERIYGLPLSVDTLALFYNKDLLNAAGIPVAPTTWEQLQNDVTTLTRQSASGDILQSGIALGTTGNVERSSDIITLLMMQNGVRMTDERGRVTFAQNSQLALDAFTVYTDFASPVKQVYTWNSAFGNSFNAFAQGQTAMFLGYSYHIPLLRTAAPRLNFEVAKAPQISPGSFQEVNFANYWVEAVSKNSQHANWAWDFINFAASEEQVSKYLTKAQKPTALRNLIASQIDDPYVGPFAQQVLTARSWYKGKDIDATEAAINEVANAILAGTDEADKELNLAASKVSQTY